MLEQFSKRRKAGEWITLNLFLNFLFCHPELVEESDTLKKYTVKCYNSKWPAIQSRSIIRPL